MSDDQIEVLRPHDEEHRTYILVTGANSGLGFAICQRLIEEFVQTRPPFQSLTIIPTTRDIKKAKCTLAGLQKHVRRLDAKWEENLSNRVNIQPEVVDLTSLSSVRALATKLLDSIPHLDTIICNAGYGGTTGINWPLCFWTLATNLKSALTYPTYKLSGTGYTTAPQAPFVIPSSANKEPTSTGRRPSTNDLNPSSKPDPPLGKVFTSNVFGHYLLTHFLLSLLSASPDAGRLIWESSLEAYPDAFSTNDLQALTTSKAYESSKRLIDILILTSALPCTSPFVKRFLTPPISTPSSTSGHMTGIQLQDNEEEEEEAATPRISLTDHDHHPRLAQHSAAAGAATNSRSPAIYLTHPGICATNFLPLPFILQLCMAAAFFLARWLGSPWHTVSTWKGAKAPVWTALATREEMEDLELEGGRGKWGSCVDWFGREGLRRTVVKGWGVGGMVGEGGGDMVASREEREEFEEAGRECWKELETLRVAWEIRLWG